MYSFKILVVVVCAVVVVNSSSIRTRIINGQEVVKTIPWVGRVLLQYKQTSAGTAITTICGGSLIAPQWFLTAKHCLLNNATKEFSDEYHVSLGNIDYALGQIIKSDKHFFLATKSYINKDLCLMHLESAPKGITPIPVQYEDDIDYDGKMATLYGWGLTDPKDEGSGVRNLRTTKVKLQSRSDCGEDTICFDPTSTNTNSCKGDSGGPMTLVVDGATKLVGVSHVGEITNGVQCTGHFSSYTSTSYYGKWIKDTMKENS